MPLMSTQESTLSRIPQSSGIDPIDSAIIGGDGELTAIVRLKDVGHREADRMLSKI